MLQFLYKLKLREDLLDDNNWTDVENKEVEKHFLRLKEDFDSKKVIHAGRTLNQDKNSFGIVIFLADSEEDATKYMNEDPAVKNGVMTASLFPYKVALLQSNFEA